jgi:hypothetical protein
LDGLTGTILGENISLKKYGKLSTIFHDDEEFEVSYSLQQGAGRKGVDQMHIRLKPKFCNLLVASMQTCHQQGSHATAQQRLEFSSSQSLPSPPPFPSLLQPLPTAAPTKPTKAERKAASKGSLSSLQPPLPTAAPTKPTKAERKAAFKGRLQQQQQQQQQSTPQQITPPPPPPPPPPLFVPKAATKGKQLQQQQQKQQQPQFTSYTSTSRPADASTSSTTIPTPHPSLLTPQSPLIPPPSAPSSAAGSTSPLPILTITKSGSIEHAAMLRHLSGRKLISFPTNRHSS